MIEGGSYGMVATTERVAREVHNKMITVLGKVLNK